jgi:pilus assembly protein Flp/PilA
MNKLLARFSQDDSGATAIEYGMIAALISVVILPALVILGPKLFAAFDSVEKALK